MSVESNSREVSGLRLLDVKPGRWRSGARVQSSMQSFEALAALGDSVELAVEMINLV